PHDRDDRDSQALGEKSNVQSAAAGLDFVEHRQRGGGRQAEREDRGSQGERSFQRAAVEHDEHSGGFGVLDLAEQHLARHSLVFGLRVEAVESRQVEHDRSRLLAAEKAFFLFDRHARVIRNLLSKAGERVEERRLAAVGRPDERDTGRLGGGRDGAHALRTRMRRASLRRKQSKVPRKRKTEGSPSGARLSREIGVSGKRPRSWRRSRQARSMAGSKSMMTAFSRSRR